MLAIEDVDYFAKEIFSECLEQSTKKIDNCFNENPEILVTELLNVFDELFLKCQEMQKKSVKNKIAFIHLFYLKSALLAETYEIQLSLFDKNSYFDKTPCFEKWVPKILINYFLEDFEHFLKLAKSNIVGLDYASILAIKMKYYDIYLVLIGKLILKKAEEIPKMDSFKLIDKEENLKIIYGGYMDMGLQVYPPLEVSFCDTI